MKQINIFTGEPEEDEPFGTDSPINQLSIKTQNEKLYRFLKSGNIVNTFIAQRKWGITRFSARIHELKKKKKVKLFDRFVTRDGTKFKEFSMKPFPPKK